MTGGQAPAPLFQAVAIIGYGLIGSSLGRVAKARGLAGRVIAIDRNPAVIETVQRLGLADLATSNPAAVAEADLVILCVPVGACGTVAETIAPHLRPGAILSDVGSVKGAVVQAVAPHVPPGVAFIPGHPVAGTENSGPEAGFAELFEERWCILTPMDGTAHDAPEVERLKAFWEGAGSKVAVMSPDYHDRVLAITSHLPHLIAYTIVGTATDLEDHMQHEVVKFSAGGFRDFTRIAASDPVMWRDVFLNNREAVLEMLGRLYEDIAILARAIRVGDGKTLEDKFTRTRAIRRGIIAARQETPEHEKAAALRDPQRDKGVDKAGS